MKRGFLNSDKTAKPSSSAKTVFNVKQSSSAPSPAHEAKAATIQGSEDKNNIHNDAEMKVFKEMKEKKEKIPCMHTDPRAYADMLIKVAEEAESTTVVCKNGLFRPIKAGTSIDSKWDATALVKKDPLNMGSDYRWLPTPYFGFFPPCSQAPEMVIIDHSVEFIRKAASWPVWKEMEASKTDSRVDNVPFNLAHIEGKGLGLIAKQEIKAGELIVKERPIYIAQDHLNLAADQMDLTGGCYKSALSRLGQPQQDAFLSLANSQLKFDDNVIGIDKTNAWEIKLEGLPGVYPSQRSAVFPTLSRANHSCRPNTCFSFHSQDLTGRYYAVRDIAEGEEITAVYCDIETPRAFRQAHLSKIYRFKCFCEACALPSDSTEANTSDENRLYIKRISEACKGPINSLPSLEEIEQALRKAEEEGLQRSMQDLCFGAALVLKLSGGSSDYGDASAWRLRALEWSVMCEGPDNINYRAMQRRYKRHKTKIPDSPVKVAKLTASLDKLAIERSALDSLEVKQQSGSTYVCAATKAKETDTDTANSASPASKVTTSHPPCFHPSTITCAEAMETEKLVEAFMRNGPGPRPTKAGTFIKPIDDRTSLVQKDPLILLSDQIQPKSPYFGFFPPGSDSPELVLIDHSLDFIKDAARWPIWKSDNAWKLNNDTAEALFDIMPIKGKGKGMVAKCDIKMGGLIARERPIYISQYHLFMSADQCFNGDVYRSALSRLGQDQQQAFLSLHNCKDRSEEPVGAIIKTNSQTFSIPNLPSTQQHDRSACYAMLSKANHSCQPNANYCSNTADFTGRLYAMCDIAKGEEITILYCDVMDTREERQAELYAKYRFHCTCKACTLPAGSDEAKLSDASRTYIKHISDMCDNTVDKLPTVVEIQEAIRLATNEGLPGVLEELCFSIALVLKARGGSTDEGGAEIWLARALRWCAICEGEGSHSSLLMQRCFDAVKAKVDKGKK